MKIIRLHIENFGKLHDFTLENMENLVSIYRENGWGKSTLAEFIGAMFYGMAKKGNNKAYSALRSKRKSWQGGVYGGSLDFECESGRYRIVRTFGDTPEGDTFALTDLLAGVPSEKFTKNVGEELFGVGKETFDITAFFPQLNLFGVINDEMRANLTGANKFEYDLQNFANAQKKINEKIKILKRDIAPKAEIERLMAKKGDLSIRLNSLNEEKSHLNKQNFVDLDSIKCEIENERKIKEEVDEYNRKKNALESEILNIQTQISSLPTTPQKKVSKSLIGGVSALAVALLTAIILLGVFKIFELAGTIAIALVIVIGYVVAIMLLAKRSSTTPIKDDEKAKLLSQKQAEYQKYSEEKIYDEGKLQSLQMQYYTVDKELSIKNEKQKSIEREITELTIEYEEVVDELERQKEKSVNAQNNIKLLTKTLQLMETAQTRVSQRYIEPMQMSFNKYFSALADKNITLNVNFDALERTNLGDKEFEYLSQGYQDVVSICRRIALIEKIYEKEKPVLILDDPFVNLDDKKLEIMKDLIKDLSKSYQVFYFYCHKKSSIEI